jgi:hypothetical protein
MCVFEDKWVDGCVFNFEMKILFLFLDTQTRLIERSIQPLQEIHASSSTHTHFRPNASIKLFYDGSENRPNDQRRDENKQFFNFSLQERNFLSILHTLYDTNTLAVGCETFSKILFSRFESVEKSLKGPGN